MNKKSKSIFGLLFAFLIGVTSLFATTTSVHASSNLAIEKTNYTYSGVSSITGNTVNDNIWKLKMDGKYVFCIESGIYTNSGDGYIPSNFTSSKKELLSKIAYYGYTVTGKSDYDYAVTQVMIWEALGDTYKSSNIPNYHTRKAQIMAQVNSHNTLPSWHNKQFDVTVGDSITLTDTNSIFSGMQLASNPTGVQLQVNGNQLKITPSASSNDGTITYRKVPTSQIGASIVYKKPQHQTLVEFHLEQNVEANIKLNVIRLGNLEITKVDEVTNKPLAGAKLRFTYLNKTQDIVTDANGLATVQNIPEGTKVTVTEVTAPNGYFNKGELKTFIIEPNKTIKVKFDNKPQQGILDITKQGKKMLNFDIIESEYGNLHQLIFDDSPLAGVTFEIRAKEDIVVGGTTHAKGGDVVATVSTGENGKLMNMPPLFLGKYEAVELSAPYGYIIDKTPISFEFTYQGQHIEFTSQSAIVKNDFQTLKLKVFKNEETIIKWKDNQPVISEIKANNKVFGLYSNQDFVLGDKVLEKDNLLAYGTVKNGELDINIQLPNGQYYFKELDSGAFHDINTGKYEFEFISEDNNTTREILIQDNDAPILNKLHFNRFSIKKLNEVATLTEKDGYTFSYEENGKGTIFTLEDEQSDIIKTVTINKHSVGTFTTVPAGTFYLKEQNPATADYVLSPHPIKIVSTKDALHAYDHTGKLIAEQNNDNEDETILFEIKNDLIKGTGKLKKIDFYTGDVLAGAKIQILDKDKNIIKQGTTNDAGFFIVSDLPKGTYYFQEYGAPNGYQLNDRLVKFEIKDNYEIVSVELENAKIDAKLPQTGDTRGMLVGLFGILLITSGTTLLYLKLKPKKKD